MKINVECAAKRAFSELERGDVFQYNGYTLMKCDRPTGQGPNAVRLDNGVFFTLANDIVVQPVKGVLEVRTK